MSNYISAFKRKDQASCETSSKTGEPTQVDHPSFILGNRNELRKIKVKFYLLLLLSNISLIAIFHYSQEVGVEVQSEVELINHEKHTKLKLALKTFLEIPKGKREIPVSLYTREGNLLIEKAFLHPIGPEALSEELSFEGSDIKLIEVEIPDDELKKIISLNISFLKAYPYQEKAIIHKAPRRTAYEIRI